MRTKSIVAAVWAVTASLGIAQESKNPPAKGGVNTPAPTQADAPILPPVDPRQPNVDAGFLTAADIRDWKGFAKRLEVMGEAELLPTAAVWRNLPAEAKAAVKRIARAERPEAADQRAVLEAVNAWVDDQISSVRVALRAEEVRDLEVQALLKKLNRAPAENRKLNRLLIESMFPFEVRQQPALAAAPASQPAAQPRAEPAPPSVVVKKEEPPAKKMETPPVRVAEAPKVDPNAGKAVPPAKMPDERTVSAYPPGQQRDVTLVLRIPRLRGRLNVFFKNEETVAFNGDRAIQIKAPNTGSLSYAFSGDEYGQPFPRSITWTDEEVKNSNGVIERTLPLRANPQ